MGNISPIIENYTISNADICADYVLDWLAIIHRKSEYVYYRKGSNENLQVAEPYHAGGFGM